MDVQNYVPPPWAPPYDNVSTIRYYYLPDYEMYYDVWDRQFWYMGDGDAWISSAVPPSQDASVDLGSSFVVLIDRDMDHPWEHHDYYRQNYPNHGYDNYRDIVVKNRIVTNIAPNHELVPRAFNENTNRVTFMQRPSIPTPPPQPQRGQDHPVPPPPMVNQRYHQVVHEVPMKNISPSMPEASRKLNYGGGYSKTRAPQNNPKPAAGNDRGEGRR
jgi:hypothetical protein